MRGLVAPSLLTGGHVLVPLFMCSNFVLRYLTSVNFIRVPLSWSEYHANLSLPASVRSTDLLILQMLPALVH
jgi:hypothetical protein